MCESCEWWRYFSLIFLYAQLATLPPWTVSRRLRRHFRSLSIFNCTYHLILMLLHALYDCSCTVPLNRLPHYSALEIIVTLLLYMKLVCVRLLSLITKPRMCPSVKWDLSGAWQQFWPDARPDASQFTRLQCLNHGHSLKQLNDQLLQLRLTIMSNMFRHKRYQFNRITKHGHKACKYVGAPPLWRWSSKEAWMQYVLNFYFSFTVKVTVIHIIPLQLHGMATLSKVTRSY